MFEKMLAKDKAKARAKAEIGVEIEAEEALETIQGQIEEIQAVVVDGNTIYYFMLDGHVYRANINLNEALPFIEAGQDVEFITTEDGVVREIQFD